VITKKKRPWYIWLSLFGFALLCADTSRRIKIKKGNFILWNRACGNIIKLIILYAIAPIVILYGLAALIFRDIELGATASEIVNLIILVMLYFIGVVAVCKHVDWRMKNISHLLKPKETDNSHESKP